MSRDADADASDADADASDADDAPRGEDLYAILGLRKEANPSAKDIKRAYHRKALELHPDKNVGDASAEILAKRTELKSAPLALQPRQSAASGKSSSGDVRA